MGSRCSGGVAAPIGALTVAGTLFLAWGAVHLRVGTEGTAAEQAHGSKAAGVADRRFALILFETFGVAALLLAAIGIYGVLSGSVTERTREIGVRLALGGQPSDVLGMILRQGLKLTLSGVGIGLLAAWVLTRLLTTLLYGVSATDPLIFGGVALLLSAVALLACYLPAKRAVKINPASILRREG